MSIHGPQGMPWVEMGLRSTLNQRVEIACPSNSTVLHEKRSLNVVNWGHEYNLHHADRSDETVERSTRRMIFKSLDGTSGFQRHET